MKGIGALTLLLTGLGLGMTARHTLEQRIRFLSLFERFLQCVSEQVRYTAMPMGRVFCLLAGSSEFENFSLLRDTVENLSADGDFRTAWQQNIPKSRREWALSERESTLLLDFAEGLGTSDITGEIRHCEQYARLVRECLEQRKEEARTRGGLYTALGLCGGCAAALMLL